jgi:hypothetical protein
MGGRPGDSWRQMLGKLELRMPHAQLQRRVRANIPGTLWQGIALAMDMAKVTSPG